MITTLKSLVKKVDNMHEQMENFSREAETIKKNLMEMLEIKSTVTEEQR